MLLLVTACVGHAVAEIRASLPLQGHFRAGQYMPVLGGFRQISDGYVALDLFRVGWIATSIDGVAWQKLPIR